MTGKHLSDEEIRDILAEVDRDPDTLTVAEIIDRATLSEPGKPLARERWAGVIDSVGSHTWANA